MFRKSFFICLVLGFIGLYLPVEANAQIQMHVSGRNHYNVTSYNGFQTTKDQGHKIQFGLQGQGVSVQNWTITARINAPLMPDVPNVSGLPFPAEKIKFRFTQEEITGNPPLPLPTFSNIAASLSPIPLQQPGTEAPLIRNAPTPLQTGDSYYVNVIYYFGIDIEGGKYLDGMLSDNGGQPWNTNPALYRTSVTFTLYDANRNVVANHDYAMAIQVHRPLGDAPEAAFSLSILGEARNGALVFNSMQDYLDGKSITYQDGLKVNASTAYEVSVKSLQENFLGQEVSTLPVNMVQVQLSPGSSGSGYTSLPIINLSVSPQTVISSNKPTNEDAPQLFHIKYNVQGNNSRLYQAQMGSYSTTILYQLYPR